MTPDLLEYYGKSSALGEWFGPVLLAVAIRDAIRKAIALRKSGTKKHLIRFIVIFILNTGGILPIVYLAFFQKGKRAPKSKA